MKLRELVEGVRDGRRIGRALSPAIPRLPWSPVTSLRAFRNGRALQMMQEASTRGDIVRVDLLYKPTLLVRHPDAVGEILGGSEAWRRTEGLSVLIGRNTLTTNGAEWEANRRMIQPSFHPSMGDRATQSFARDAAEAISGWAAQAKSPEPTDIAWHAVHLFARCGTRFLGFALTDDEVNRYPGALLRLQRWAFKVVAGGARRSAQVRADMAMLEGIVARALAAPPAPGEPPTYVERLRQDLAVDRERLRDHGLLTLVASTDNPPNAFAFAVWLLSRHPEHQEAARAEVAAVLGREVPTPEALERMPLLERILLESMRLLPGVWFVYRVATEDSVLLGHAIPKGTSVFPSAWFLHRHPKFWDAPEEFRPDRFLPREIERRHRFAYLPFGAGPRTCIASRFATLEVRALLALFLQRFRAHAAGPPALPLEGMFALRSPTGVPVRLEALPG